jgi:hypothetical protein
LFLLAFVNEDLKAHQNLGWNIIGDKEIITEAKEKYLLIILDSNDLKNQNVEAEEDLFKEIRAHNAKVFFIITNQAFYPFSSWQSNEEKAFIIGRLNTGDGP